MNREDIIKFIPKPSNKDVILYDISLSDLIDEDVLIEYNKLYPVFIDKKEKYSKIKARTEEYEKSLNSIYLFKPYWSEEDYLQNLQDAKKTYSTMYGEIKKIENNIEMLKRNLKGINEKIIMQIKREDKFTDSKKQEMDKQIESDKTRLLDLKKQLDFYMLTASDVEIQIENNEKEFNSLSKMLTSAEQGKCKCEMCGRTIKSVEEGSIFAERMQKNIKRNKKDLERLLERKTELDTNIDYYKSEIKKVKDDLDNILQFYKENNQFYHKKTAEVLKLEALRDEMLNNISKLQKQLESNSRAKSRQYTDLKSTIEKYELSLDNLKKIKELKEQSAIDIEEFNSLRNELRIMLNKINQYVKFISIYYKILEQKASEYCGPDYKFKFYKLEEYHIIPILEITYKGTEYSQLNKRTMDEIDKYLIEKFSIFL